MGIHLSIDPHVLHAVTLAGHTIGLLGAMFFAYHILGPQLRTFLTYALPATIGAVLAATIGFPLYLFAVSHKLLPLTPSELSQLPAVLVDLLSAGLFVGLLYGWQSATATCSATCGKRTSATPAVRPTTFRANGSVLGQPWRRLLDERMATFSLPDAVKVGLLAVAYSVLVDLFYDALLGFADVVHPNFWIAVLVDALTFGLVAAIIGGWWRSRHPIAPKPVAFSWQGARTGAQTLFWFQFISWTLSSVVETLLLPHDPLPANPFAALLDLAISPLVWGVAAAVAGFFIGGLARAIASWSASAEEQRFERIGIILLGLGFLALTLEPLVGLLD